jgi:hypothetical protein
VLERRQRHRTKVHSSVAIASAFSHSAIAARFGVDESSRGWSVGDWSAADGVARLLCDVVVGREISADLLDSGLISAREVGDLGHDNPGSTHRFDPW